ncbi:toll/interleukin-1 receptor domain-containing protein [Chryseobacterium sp. ISL-6]|uniref:toll/interleukin-1 receptor domain-containing protein n=1 Tax=Chryseobacterium sp. ISL-6 TaxID=2819143 RepID=UPI001BEBC72D|nr:toll/interleukin-1 receptor domain-containing protein [Chryseobacterium sp. ISL-6]MBT2623714.1 toll/interleukin-1 receptor domain-containing protein [Chryseobacterium sp. ISL-6]
MMKIFIYHSSKNKYYGEAFVDLLRSIGLKETEIIFTSNTAYGIPVGQNIFNWLKSQITEKPFVIYLLSEEYYQSIACLNEMGAAWIIENKHAAIFTPNFNLSSKEFQSGALDPREIGFYINDEERILSFLSLIAEDFEITKNPVIISQNVKKFIKVIEGAQNEKILHKNIIEQDSISKKEPTETLTPQSLEVNTRNDSPTLLSKLKDLILLKKLKDEELILLHYIIDRGRFYLMTGWQEINEIESIKEWEEINDIKPVLSRNYSQTLKRFQIRGFIEVSNRTSYGNPKEFKVKDEISEDLLDLDENSKEEINKCLNRNFEEHIRQSTDSTDSLPF